ncbi:MAG: DUF362 domain-containing protein [Deltaproteobacteria bacterium]|jgi:uncharacterized protein (DUF362 family)|nr:DUF362 domain-containing protein [Deltaproteobacteria bacterium]MBW2478473.1 DUF362 domain-containing protein [Deltaproteobacteria bacterium]
MSKNLVAIVRYDEPLESVRQAVELSRGLDHLPSKAKVFIKPNIVFWTRAVPFPKWGVITTSRVVEDVIVLLKERGIDDITVGEGMVTMNPRDLATPAHAYETLGYGKMKQKYGINVMNIFERPFKKVDFGDGVVLRFNADALDSDFVVDLPVMKAHNQTVVSLGIKNLKGLIDIPSRKKCHNMTPGRDLHFWVSKLADKMPPMLTLQDGIFTNERGPGPDGKLHRSNLLVASADVLSADLVGAAVLGYSPEQVPHLMHAAENHGRPWDFSDIEVVGESIDAVARHHAYDFEYSETAEVILPTPLVKQGLKGVFYQKYDLSMCTYCSQVNGLMMSAIRFAWKGKAWDDVEILTGKSMQPSPGKKKTILLGKCIYQAHKDNPGIQEAIAIKGCPPKTEDMLKALHRAGIEADPGLFENVEALPGFFMGRYQGQLEYDEGFFQVE